MFNYPFMEVSKTVDNSIVANSSDGVTINFGYFTTDDAKLPASPVIQGSVLHPIAILGT